jgi:hypothetical protein
MDLRQCKTCGEEKPLDMYTITKTKNGKQRIRTQCKVCRCQEQKERRENNIEKYKENDRLNYEKNKDVKLERNKEYRLNNREFIIEQKKIYYMSHIESIKDYHHKTKAKRNERLKTKRVTDPIFKLVTSLRSRACVALKSKKTNKTLELLRCTKQQLLQWLSYQFDENMSFDNYGMYWHIDHVIPVSFFDFSEPNQQYICFHWSNLQPMECKANINKSNKIKEDDIQTHAHKVDKYYNKNKGYQTNIETCWWQRVKLWDGKNSDDKEMFESFLKRAIRSQAANAEKQAEGSTTKRKRVIFKYIVQDIV